MECVPITAQYSVTWYLKYAINGKIQISAWLECEPEAWEVCTEREVSWDTAGTQQNRNRRCRKVASLTLPSFARLPCDVMAGFTWLIKFLSDYGNISDPFPRCGIGSGHARLLLNSHLTSRPWGHSQCIHWWMGLSNWRYNILILNWPCWQAHIVQFQIMQAVGLVTRFMVQLLPIRAAVEAFTDWLHIYDTLYNWVSS